MGLVFVFKAIKPKKMNMDVYALEITNELRKESVIHRQILGRTTTGWKNRPVFESIYDFDGEDASVVTGPVGDIKAVLIWTGLDEGIPAHTITARNAPMLVFQTGYKPKTTVGKFTSGQSKRFGSWRRTRSVRHPGVEARGWSERLTKDRQKPFEDRMQEAIARAANKTF